MSTVEVEKESCGSQKGDHAMREARKPRIISYVLTAP